MDFRDQFSDAETDTHRAWRTPEELGWVKLDPSRFTTPSGQTVEFLPGWPRGVWIKPPS